MTVMLNKVIGSFLDNGLKNSTSRHANTPHLYASPSISEAAREKQNADITKNNAFFSILKSIPLIFLTTSDNTSSLQQKGERH
jgi:hypothetical protein